MRLEDFAPQSRAIDVGGRRYVCHPPTLAVVHRFLSLFWAEVAATASAYSSGAEWEASPVDDLLSLFTRDERCDWVLCQCVDDYDSGDEAARDTLCRTVLSLCDVPRIVASLNLESAAPTIAKVLDNRLDEEDQSAVSEAAIGVCLLAERLNMTPLEVMQMPYEAYLTARESVVAIDERRLAEARRSARDAQSAGRGDVFDSSDMNQLKAFYGLPRA